MSGKSGFAPVLESADRLMRSWWTLVAGLCLGLAGSLVALDMLPKTFEATTKILVAPQKIPQDFVKNTINDDAAMRIAALKDAVLSRPYMMTLIDKAYGPQPNEAATQALLNTIRSRVEVNVERFSGDRTGMFSLRYRDDNPQRAAQFVNDLADLYIKENAKYRSGRAKETTSTIEDLAQRAREQLDAKERVIAAFRSEHLYELPERNDANLRMLEARQRDLEANTKVLQAAQERLQMLQSQNAAAGSATLYTGTTSAPVDSYTSKLNQLQRELAALKARYYDDHPEVRAKTREIADFIAAGGGAATEDRAQTGRKASPSPMSPLERDIHSQTVELNGLQDEQKRIRSDIALYSARIERAPQVQQQLEERMKGYDVLKQQFNDYQGKVESAKGAQTIEEAQKGEQFEVIERAIPPALPVSPIPLVVIGLGTIAGLLIFAGPVVALGFLRPTVDSEELLKLFVTVPVLVTIPRIQTEAMRRRAFVERFRNVALSSVSVVVLAAVLIVMLVR